MPSHQHPAMPRHVFHCLDGHTCGNPVRLVASGGPILHGADMSARRQDFIAHHDWIRRALMFEPRGHDMMSGSILYPPTRDDCDIAILFIETTGCLPMCGHGTIGTVTMAIENGLVQPREPGRLALDAPAGRVVAEYDYEGEGDGRFVDRVRIHNIPSFLAAEGVRIDCPGVGELVFDVAYGGNFYAILEPQPNWPGLEESSADEILRLSPIVRRLANQAIAVTHPDDPTIAGISHIQWTGAARDRRAHARNAVFYGDRAIDRSPCGTGTSARMAQLAARGTLRPGDEFIHESIIGSLFDGRVEEATTVGNLPAIRPSIAGWARQHGDNTITVDPRDPFAHGFQVT